MEPDEELWEWECRQHYGDTDEGGVLEELFEDLQEGDRYEFNRQ